MTPLSGGAVKGMRFVTQAGRVRHLAHIEDPA
jgi:hypothetical protein